MKTTTLLTTAALFIALVFPTSAAAMSRRQALRTFCGGVREINAAGLAVSPGTVGGYRLASEARLNQNQYRNLWDNASTSAEPLCRGIY